MIRHLWPTDRSERHQAHLSFLLERDGGDRYWFFRVQQKVSGMRQELSPAALDFTEWAEERDIKFRTEPTWGYLLLSGMLDEVQAVEFRIRWMS